MSGLYSDLMADLIIGDGRDVRAAREAFVGGDHYLIIGNIWVK